MKHLHLLLPDLFPPQDIAAEVCAGLRLPALERILARSAASASRSIAVEDWLCAAFAAEGVAPVRAAADGLETGDGYWVCADPVGLQLRHAQVVVLPEVELSREEAAALCASLNEHFAGAGQVFHAPQPQRWYLRLPEPLQATMYPLSQVAWHDAKLFLPRGEDAMRWQRLVTEVQMLLHAHPVNQAREARGVQPVNSLWLWGGGHARPLRQAFDAVGGDSELASAFAATAGVPQAASLRAMLQERDGNGLWLCTPPATAQQQGDYHAWRDVLQRLEQDVAQPLLRAVRAGKLQRLTLEVLQAEGQRFELTPGAAWRIWRVPRPLSRYAV